MSLNFIYRLTVSSLICFTLAGSMTFSQQLNHFLMEDLVPFRNNPAYTGDRDLNDTIIMTRQQWTDFEGAPLFETRFSATYRKMGAGLVYRSLSVLTIWLLFWMA